ncbi:isoprenylcysteine carboxylmethyltransferase family protein [Variovorax sp. RCC_210]|uniref:methyltransferase family protein n=1 Tax=Variovorax sp. RCC_210 TaxID=3239217 RepID=UPI003523E330
MLFWFQLFLFVAGTAALLYVSRGPLSQPGSHGFYRFFAWECMLVLIVLNLPTWHDDPFSPKQIVSSVFFVLSIWLPIHAVRLLKAVGKPTEARNDDPALYGFEKTSSIVKTGAFRYIRHPMYTALLLLAWGAFLKQFTWLTLALVLAATVLLFLTALRDEQECIAHFGDDYRAYMRGTRRFIPFVL